MKTARVLTPVRNQMQLVGHSLDDLVPDDAPVRAVWTYVESLDLSSFYLAIRAVEGGPGRPAIDPRVLLALWIFATSEGIGSARQIDRLCERDVMYRWLCGGVGVNYHALATFRSQNADQLDGLLTQHVTALVDAKVIQLKTIVQDGVRIRASAGSSSFRRRSRLETIAADVAAQIKALKGELEDDPGASDRRALKRKQMAAEQRQEKLRRALERARELEQKRAQTQSHKSKADQEKSKRKAAKGDVRASSTDPDAHRMKMGDGGYRPAYNEQVAIDPKSGFIVATETTNEGLDGAMLPPMVAKIEKDYNALPETIIADGGFVTKAAVETLYQKGVDVVAPVDKPRSGRDPYTRMRRDSEGVGRWRERMGTEAGRSLYKMRSLVEWIFARYRNWNLRLLRVRGRVRVRSAMLLSALTHNILHDIARLNKARQQVKATTLSV